MIKAVMHTDGGARGNPGPAAIGIVLEIEGKKTTYAECIGKATNNVAEYRAVLEGLKKARAAGATHVTSFLDSELVVRQLNREYRVRDNILGPLFVQVWNIVQEFHTVTFRHIPRAENAEADRLLNNALDSA